MADSTPKRKLYIDIVSDTVCPWYEMVLNKSAVTALTR